ncbi:MAG: hypothetical protein GF417_09895 [Candidatus Latescibacteria bacterium]|nr:hypothetical protein [bacterium]MBD3424738.1 hypothetical protein [Candidatus Latescibacterota bacterium]
MFRKLTAVLILLALALSGNLASQQFPVEDEDGPEIAGWLTSGDTMRVYPEVPMTDSTGASFTEYLPSREVRALYASYDTLWIGTEGGLYAWDIMRDSLSAVSSFPLGSVRSITVDDYYRLWVGCERGVCLRDSTWQVYPGASYPFFRRIRELSVGSERIWIATYGQGCGYLKSDSLIIYTRADSLLDDRVNAIAEETASSVWFGTASGVCRADSFRWESMRYGRKIPIGSVNDLIFDENRNLFVAVRQNGIARLKFGETESFGIRDGLPGWNINAFSLAPDGILIGAGEGGACYYDGSGWTPLVAEGIPLSGFNFLSVHHDFSGNCFLGSDDGSVIVLERDGWKRLNIPQRFPALRVAGINEFLGELFIITNRGFYRRVEGGELEMIAMPAPWYQGAVTGMAVLGGSEFWLSTRFGALYFRDGHWKVYDRRVGLPTEYLTSVAAGQEGEIWFGTFDRGVLCLREGKWYSYMEEDGTTDNRISDLIAGRDGVVWALTLSGRLIEFDQSGWSDETPVGPDTAGGGAGSGPELSIGQDPAVRVLSGREENPGAVRKGVCLAGGREGSCLFVDPEAVYSNLSGEWMKFPLPDTGENPVPVAALETGSSGLWIGTAEKGILVLKGNRWVNYDIDSGFTGGKVISMAEGKNGVIWIGTASRGLHRVERRGYRGESGFME